MYSAMAQLDHAQDCLMGQLAGNALGCLVEFRSPEDIARQYPHGVHELANGGTWNTLAGQPTDDSEMALMLARSLVERGTYEAGSARKAYRFWLDSGPFDCGMEWGHVSCRSKRALAYQASNLSFSRTKRANTRRSQMVACQPDFAR